MPSYFYLNAKLHITVMSKFRFYLILILCAQWGYGKTTVEGVAYEYFLKAEYEILQNNFIRN